MRYRQWSLLAVVALSLAIIVSSGARPSRQFGSLHGLHQIAAAHASAQTARTQAPPVINVVVDGRWVLMPSGATVSSLLDQEGIRPSSGRLLSLLGNVLRPDAYAPTITLNGDRVDPARELRSADEVEALAGLDQTEPTTVETYVGGAENPQFALRAGTVTVRRGAMSGEVEPISSSSDAGPPQVALTFDDGPDPRFTPALLDVLDRAGVKATFFDVGVMASRSPDLVRRELADGMVVGDHSWSHPSLLHRLQALVGAQLLGTKEELASLGANVKLFRPPYGSFDGSTVAVAASIGLRTVLWSVDPRDWSRPGTDAIVARVLSQVRPGSIVLFHDAGGDRSQTIAALPLVLEALKLRGYKFVLLA